MPFRKLASRSALACCLTLPFGASASAAVLTGQFNADPASPANLDSTGAADWAIWNHTAGTRTGAPTNEKLGGTLISNAVAVGGSGTLRGVGGTSQAFTYTGGTPTASQTNATIGGLSNEELDAVGAGFRFTVTGDPTKDTTVSVYLGGFGGTGTLTATLNGATTYTQASNAYSNTAPKDRDLYTITFRPDNPGDVLTVSYVLSADNGTVGSSHVLLSGVAVAVPEPGTLGLAAVGIVGMLARRRRRRH